MLPLRNAYGKWPASGEIDIVESRGNHMNIVINAILQFELLFRYIKYFINAFTLKYVSEHGAWQSCLIILLTLPTCFVQLLKCFDFYRKWLLGNREYHDDQGNDQSVKNAGSTLHFGSDFYHNKYPTAHGER